MSELRELLRSGMDDAGAQVAERVSRSSSQDLGWERIRQRRRVRAGAQGAIAVMATVVVATVVVTVARLGEGDVGPATTTDPVPSATVESDTSGVVTGIVSGEGPDILPWTVIASDGSGSPRFGPASADLVVATVTVDDGTIHGAEEVRAYSGDGMSSYATASGETVQDVLMSDDGVLVFGVGEEVGGFRIVAWDPVTDARVDLVTADEWGLYAVAGGTVFYTTSDDSGRSCLRAVEWGDDLEGGVDRALSCAAQGSLITSLEAVGTTVTFVTTSDGSACGTVWTVEEGERVPREVRESVADVCADLAVADGDLVAWTRGYGGTTLETADLIVSGLDAEVELGEAVRGSIVWSDGWLYWLAQGTEAMEVRRWSESQGQQTVYVSPDGDGSGELYATVALGTGPDGTVYLQRSGGWVGAAAELVMVPGPDWEEALADMLGSGA